MALYFYDTMSGRMTRWRGVRSAWQRGPARPSQTGRHNHCPPLGLVGEAAGPSKCTQTRPGAEPATDAPPRPAPRGLIEADTADIAPPPAMSMRSRDSLWVVDDEREVEL